MNSTKLSFYSLPVIAQKTIDDLFEVRLCDSGQKALLNSFIPETLQLVNTALTGIETFLNGEEYIIKQNLLSYFKTKKGGAN